MSASGIATQLTRVVHLSLDLRSLSPSRFLTVKGYSMASDKPAYINLYSAAGNRNGMGSLNNAYISYIQLVIITGQQVRSMIGIEALLATTNATELP